MSQTLLIWMVFAGIFLSALLVFGICFYIQKQFFANQALQHQLEIQKSSVEQTLPLKLQAYERLTLLFERIHIPTLIPKFKRSKMSSGELQAALMVAIQQEFEHNVSQQIYVSEKLWQVIAAAKQELFNQIEEVMIKVAYSEDGDIYSNALVEHFARRENDPSRKAIFAIKQEARLLIN
ncbi:MAG: hypothetical protein KTR24_04345 [Saprospiraceae bacterium]|nr:hypothetical protein [Saprospiraceae bacterium]